MTPELSPTYHAIVEAAADLFVANGYHGTSMRQIAQAAGIALGGIYNHFASKEEIFVTVICDNHPIRQLVPLLVEAEGRTAEELLRDGARRMAAVLGPDRRLLNLMFIEQVEFGGRHIPQLFDELFPPARAFARKVVQAGRGLRPLPPLAILRGYFGLIFSYAMLELLLADTPIKGDGEVVDQLMDIFLHGVLTRGEEA
jgi:AcrR family transcriptional regulator